MKNLIGIGVSVGVLAGIWTYVSSFESLGLFTWVAFVAWACFFAAGGNALGFRNGLMANLSGVVWAVLVQQFLANVGFDARIALALAVTVIGLTMCLQAAWSWLAFIPGAFAGAAVTFGTSFSTRGTIISLVAGACLGWLSAVLGARIQSLVDRPGAATATIPSQQTESPATAAQTTAEV